MKVLVTGGAGYIGSLVVEELLLSGHEPAVLDLFYWGSEALSLFGDRVKLIEGDCRSSKDVVYALEGMEAVIHLAGIVGEDACRSNYKAHYTTNVQCTRTVVDCCTDPNLEPVRDFIFLSSCSVYGNVKDLYSEVNEETPTAPLSLYADGKIQAERIIMARASEVPHFHPTILRLTTVFGWSPRVRLDLVTNLFVYKAWRNGRITLFGDGQQYRSLIHVRDVARAVVTVLVAPRFARDRRLFHVGEETNNKTVREIAEIVRLCLPGTEIETKPSQPTDRRNYRINCQRFKNILGWQAEYSVEQGIRELAEKLRSEGLDWESPRLRNNRFDYS